MLSFPTACLVTDPVDFPDEANVPPSIVSSAAAEHPIDDIVRFVADDPSMREVRFQVLVRDPNVEQRLEMRVFVDGTNPGLDRELPPSGTTSRAFEFAVPDSLLRPSPSCHKIELLTSGGFTFGSMSRAPREAGDIAQAVWWVRTTDTSNTPVDLGACP